MKALVILMIIATSGVKSSAAGVVEAVEEEARVVENEVKEVFEKVEESVKTGIQELENEFDRVKSVAMNVCNCVDYNCGCCAHLEEPDIHLNSTICTNVTYLVHDYGISFTITVNGYAIYNETISARNPPPVCLGVPYVKELADVCVRLYDINATTTSLHACVRVEARMKTVLIAKYELGCFDLGPPGFKIDVPQEVTTNSTLDWSEPYYNPHHPVEFDLVSRNPAEKGNLTLPVVASVVGLLLIALIAIGVCLGLRKRGEHYSSLRTARQSYGSTNSLLPHTDPYC